MAGVFNIHPKRLTSITCELMPAVDRYATYYRVRTDTLDFNEVARERVIFPQSRSGSGQTKSAKGGLVPIKFQMYVTGTTADAAMVNARTVKRALTNQYGGYIEYRPHGHSDSVLTTWYEYAQSEPPQIMGGAVALSEHFMGSRLGEPDTNIYAVLLDCNNILTKAWATSDPYTPVEIVAATTLDNCDGGARNNAISVASSLIKGDAVIPIITIAPILSDDFFSKMLIHKRDRPTGTADSNEDWIEAEDAYLDPTWMSSQPNAAVSDGYYVQVTADSSLSIQAGLSTPTMPLSDRSYFGKITPIIAASVASGEWEMYFYLRSAAQFQTSKTVSITTADWQIYDTFDEVQWPEIPIPDYVIDADLDDMLDYAEFRLYCTKISGGDMYLDFIIMAKTDDFIARFESVNYSLYGGAAGRYLVIDATTGTTLLYRSSTDQVYDSWNKIGSPFSDLILRKGYDSKLRFVGWAASATHYYDADDTFSVTIDGIYATIYPFTET